MIKTIYDLGHGVYCYMYLYKHHKTVPLFAQLHFTTWTKATGKEIYTVQGTPNMYPSLFPDVSLIKK